MDIQVLLGNADEKPLDRIINDGGFCGIFRTIGCVGDSLSSGEFEGTDANGEKTYHDYYEYSWGQYIARMAGTKVYNFSRGGMTAKEYCESFARDNDFWNPDKACHAYIIALGVNDIYNQNQPMGDMSDIDLDDYRNNQKTFAGYYGQIIQRLKEIQPDAKFFLLTTPQRGAGEKNYPRGQALADLISQMAALFSNTYVIDLWKYAPVYDDDFRKIFYLGGHMNPCGYILTAKMVASYIDYIIRHHMDDFKQVGFIGTPYRNAFDTGF